MAAEDWLEDQDDADDEWSHYWQRFEDETQGHQPVTPEGAESNNDASSTETDVDLTTEERLERYLLKGGMDRTRQSQVEPELQGMLQECQQMEDAQNAVDKMQLIESLMSTNTFVGGNFYLAWATALWQLGNNQWALQHCQSLINTNPHRPVVMRAKRLANDI